MAWILGLALLAWALLVAGLWALQERVIFPAPRVPETPHLAGAELRTLPGDPPVLVLFARAPKGRPTVVFFHGNGDQLSTVEGWGRALIDRGLGFLAVEYPGYGLAGGEPSEEGVYGAAERALEHLRAEGVTSERTVLSGLSLGTGVAVEMASRGHGGRLALFAPYTSVRALAERIAPLAPVGLILRHPFDSEAKLPRLTLPVLVAHGAADRVIPVEMGRRLASLSPGATYLELPGVGHDLLAARRESLADCLAAFADGRAGDCLSAAKP